jgi:immunity protein, SdpI family
MMRSVHFRKRLVIGAGYVLGASALYRGLPEYGAPPGAGTLSMNAMMLAFLLPTAAAVSDALLRRLSIEKPVGETDSTHVLAVYDAIMLRFIIFIVAVHAITLLALAGVLAGRVWAAQIVPVMLGLTMMGVGNLLPRTRPNLVIGIRTQRALSDRGLWTRIHRSIGYLLVASGMVIALASIAAPTPIGSRIVLVIGPGMVTGTWLLVRFVSKRVHA